MVMSICVYFISRRVYMHPFKLVIVLCGSEFRDPKTFILVLLTQHWVNWMLDAVKGVKGA